VYPRSFADGSGDGIGDLPGLRGRLEHLAWLGVDAVWISPIFASPMHDFGYDVSDHCAVDPTFGTLDDFDGLVADAHALGIKVLLDWVPNHTSHEHPWFVESRSGRDSAKRSWYVWRDPGPDGSPPNNWIAAFTNASAWALDERSGQLYLHQFLPEQPDLCWAEPEVEAAMHAVLRFWLDRGVDGFRMDVIHGIGKDPALPDDPPEWEGVPHTAINDVPQTHPLLRRIRAVLDGYDAVYDALPHGKTFNRLWRTHAYNADFPEEFAHIGFLTTAEAERMREILRLEPGQSLADVACGAGGPGLWMATQSGASLIGVDPSPAGLAIATRRAQNVGLADRARFQQGTFEHTNLGDESVDAVMSVEAFQYAPDKRAAAHEFARVLRPGGRLAFICFEVDPAKAAGLPVLGVDPIANYAPVLEAAGFTLDVYEETPGWEERVYTAFSAIVDAGETLAAEMGERAAAGAVAEAMLTVAMKPYPRRVLAAATRTR